MKRAFALSLAVCALAVLYAPAGAAALQVGPGGQPLQAPGADPLPTPKLWICASLPIAPSWIRLTISMFPGSVGI